MTTFSEEKGGQNDPKRGTNLPIKGDKMTTFSEEKGGQNDPKRGTNLPIKGDKMTPINKGENKEINKESGGDNAHDAREIPTLSTTTTFFEKEEINNQNKNTMDDFKAFWELYPGDPEWSHEKEACERAWYATQTSWRDKLTQQLKQGLRWRPIDKTNPERNNPLWYIKNYSGEDAQGDLPFMRQGTVKFGNWAERNRTNGIRMCITRYDGALAYCLYSDLQTMLSAGAELINDDWK